MRSNRKILFGLLLILGGFGFYRLFQSLSHLNRTPPRVATSTATGTNDSNLRDVSLQTAPGRVVETRVDIPANSIITPDMLQMSDKTLPSTEGYLTDIESQGAGQITRVDISAHSKIRRQYDLIGHVSETGIAGLLRPGTRAMIVPIANKPTLHDLVRIGNFVDVLAAFDGQESRTLLQNVRVLGVDVSANDYPNVSAAMRGPFKADAKRNGISSAEGAAPTPGPSPTPGANAGRPDPAITLEVTPRQAAALQLAIASNAALDYLVRPALPGNRSGEIVPVFGGQNAAPGTIGSDTTGLQTVSVVKSQIAPYAESRKNSKEATSNRLGKTVLGALTKIGTAQASSPRGGRPRQFVDAPPYPSSDSDSGAGAIAPFPAGQNPGSDVRPAPNFSKPVPTPTQNYVIPVYGDGKILRNETVPLPDPSR